MKPMNSKTLDADKQLTEKAQRLYQYLFQLVRLRTSVAYDIRDYIDVVWLHDIPKHKLCYCAAWQATSQDDDSIWMEIKRPHMPRLPAIPRECELWVDKSSLENLESAPVLKEKIIDEGNVGENEEIKHSLLVDFPDVQKVWGVYVEKQWRLWAEETKTLKEVQNIYS